MQILDTTVLKTNFSGNIILQEDADYEFARQTYMTKNAMPAIIVQPRSKEDVVLVLDFAKQSNLQISIRSGKHSMMGFSTNNDGLVLDLSFMNAIEVLDQTAGIVRLGGGALWGDVAKKLTEHELAITSGDTKSVGVGGLTLGGGIGWMVRKYGYAIDSLVGAEVVLADGSIQQASASENSDLFWAIRGGGGNFGVVTSFDFKAHPLKDGKVVTSTTMYTTAAIGELVTKWRDHMRTAGRNLTSFVTLMPSFGEMPAAIMVMSCYADGDMELAASAIEPLRKLGNMLNDTTIQVDYADVLQEAHPPEGMKFTVKNMFAKTLGDDLITILNELCCKPGSPIIQLRFMSGAIDDIVPHTTALPHRGNEAFLFAGFAVPISSTAEEQAENLKQWEILKPFSSGTYSNFLSSSPEDLETDIASIYPPATYERLASIKQSYDPENIFNHNYNIRPRQS